VTYPRAVTIRSARASDFRAITAITNRLIATSAIHFGYEPLGDDELAAQWRAHADRHPWFVTTDDHDTVLGYAKSGPWRERAAYAWTCETTIHLAESARGRGVGTTLYTTLLDELATRGFRSAIAGIALPNAASIALHERLGFTHVGVFRDAGFKLDAWHAVAFYQRMLTAAAS